MTGRDDYSDEMRHAPLDDATTEAVLRGEPTAMDQQLGGVSAFISEMEACASLPPPPPSPALARLLRDGSQPRAVPAVRAVPTHHRAGASLAGWRRRLAVSAIGVSVGVTGVVGAAAAGLLPAPAERVVAGVVQTLTPLHLPRRAPDPSGSPADGLHGPAAGRGGSDNTVPGGGAGGSGTGPGTGAGPGAPQQPGATTGPSGGGSGTAGATGPGASPGREPVGGSGPGITPPVVTTLPAPGVGPVPTTPATVPAVPTVTTPTIPTLPVKPPPAPVTSTTVPLLPR